MTATRTLISTLIRKTNSFFTLLSLQLGGWKKFACTAYIYYRHSPKKTEGKKVYFNFPDHFLYNRYYYTLVKYFLLENYTVYINIDLMTLYRFATDGSSNYLLKEPKVFFGKPDDATLVLGTDTISRDYFGAIKTTGTTYHVPIGQYPGMYHSGYWNEPLDIPHRKRGMFFSGNFDKRNYGQKEVENIFGVNNRRSLYHFLCENKAVRILDSEQELKEYLSGSEEGELVLVDNTSGHKIPNANFRRYVGSFDFMFAFTGVLIPLCHNLVEAMSIGSIPFIQSAYAAVAKPPLIDGETCVTFEGLDDLLEKMEAALALPQSRIDQLRSNVWQYHDRYLTPHAVIKKLESRAFEKVYLLAEYHSMCLLLQ